MKSYTYSTASLSMVFNQAKNLFVDYLQENQICSEDEAKEFREGMAFVVVEKGWLGTIFDKWWGKDEEDSAKIKLVKILK